MNSMQNNTCYVGSLLMDFPVKPQLWFPESLEATVSNVMESRFGPLYKILSTDVVPGDSHFGRICLLRGEKGLVATLKTYPKRSHITITVEYDLNEFDGNSLLSYNDVAQVEAELGTVFQCPKKILPIPEVKRALDFDTYFTTSDYRLLEYDIKEMVFDARSEFQHIQIGRSINYGNVLILDGLVNMAESDLSYTESLMCRGKVDYKNKDVLILGGGDGALLHELRNEKQKPNKITMIEIDDIVMKACKVHLRGACGNTLDNYKLQNLDPADYDNYEIIVGDCIPFMAKCEEEGLQFDYIFGDLTDIPISTTPQGEIWDFFKLTLKLSFAILKPGGTYFTHANGVSVPENLTMFENTISNSLDFPIQIVKSTGFVPSFKEKWAFYQVKRFPVPESALPFAENA